MSPYRILSVGWMAFCVFGVIISFKQFQYLGWLYYGKLTERTNWSACALVVYAAGVVASVFLDRGVMWSRMVVCIAAFFSALACGLALLAGDSPHWLKAIFAFVVLFSWISIIVLLIPKRYVV